MEEENTEVTQSWFVERRVDYESFDIYGTYDSFRKAEIVALSKTWPRARDAEYVEKNPSARRSFLYDRVDRYHWTMGRDTSVTITTRPLNEDFEDYVQRARERGVPEELLKH